jgi:Protein of unknown function (DUF3187)
VWDYSPDAGLIDGESWYVEPALRYAPFDGFDVAARWPMQRLGGGVLDAAIEAFHRALGLNQGGRDLFPRNHLLIERISDTAGATVLMNDSNAGWFTRAPVLAARLRLTAPDAAWPVALKVAADFPSLQQDNVFVANSGHDWGVGLSTAGRIPWGWAATVSLAYVEPRAAALKHGASLQGSRASLMLSVDRELGPDSALVVELLNETAVTRDTGTGLDRPTTDFLFGWKWRVVGQELELGVIEDLFIHDNNIDFGLHFAWRSAPF